MKSKQFCGRKCVFHSVKNVKSELFWRKMGIFHKSTLLKCQFRSSFCNSRRFLKLRQKKIKTFSKSVKHNNNYKEKGNFTDKNVKSERFWGKIGVFHNVKNVKSEQFWRRKGVFHSVKNVKSEWYWQKIGVFQIVKNMKSERFWGRIGVLHNVKNVKSERF